MADSFPKAIDDGAADHLQPGMALPRVRLPATSGGEVCLADIPGCTLVFIYPWTGRPDVPNPPDWDEIPGAHGSTAEIEGFRDGFTQFEQFELGIFGLSSQSTDYQREMAERLEVPFPILSDEEGEFARALSLPTFAAGNRLYLKRLTLVMTDGKIETVFYPIRDPAQHARDALRWFKREMRR